METDPNWALLEIDGVSDVIQQATARVASHYDWSADDLAQQARILVATKRELGECLDPDRNLTLGTLRYQLERQLVHHVKYEAKRRDRTESYEQRNESVLEDGITTKPAAIAIRNEVSSYSRDLVESLMPAIWDESFCYGVRVENAPDPDMPRGSTNKATGNTLAAHIADIKIGWEKAPLLLNERRALLLAYGADWTQSQAAVNLGVDQATISRWLYSGVGKIVACLNGDYALMFQLTAHECEPDCLPRLGLYCSLECEVAAA